MFCLYTPISTRFISFTSHLTYFASCHISIILFCHLRKHISSFISPQSFILILISSLCFAFKRPKNIDRDCEHHQLTLSEWEFFKENKKIFLFCVKGIWTTCTIRWFIKLYGRHSLKNEIELIMQHTIFSFFFFFNISSPLTSFPTLHTVYIYFNFLIMQLLFSIFFSIGSW